MRILFALIIGLGMLSGSGYWYHKTSAFIGHAQKAEGRVVDYETRFSRHVGSRPEGSHVMIGNMSFSTGSEDREEHPLHYPVVEFSHNGKAMRFTDKYGSSGYSYEKGAAVEVLFLPENPSQATINSFWSLWLGPLVMAILGVLFSIAGLASCIAARRNNAA